MRRNVVVNKYNGAKYLDQTQAIMFVVKTCSRKFDLCAIFHTSKTFFACVAHVLAIA